MLAFATTFDRIGSLHSAGAWSGMRGRFRPCELRILLSAGMILFALASPTSAQPPDIADQPTADGEIDAVEQEVLDNILQQPIGDTTLESLDLPMPFLRRVAGRIIRSSYQHRYHVVVEDPLASSAGDQGSPNPASGNAPSDGPSTGVHRELASPDSSKLPRYDKYSLPRIWLYLIGLAILIGMTAVALILRHSRRAQR